VDAPAVYPIWIGQPPGSESWRHSEITYTDELPQSEGDSAQGSTTMVRDVVTPTLTAYLPRVTAEAKTAAIICPGGGFRFLSWGLEGTDLAKWLASRGVAAFVLKYRLVQTSANPQQFDRENAAFLREFSRAVASGRRPNSLREMLPDSASSDVRVLASADARQAVRYVRSHASQWGIAENRIGMVGFSAGAFLVTDVIFANERASHLDFAALIYGGEVGQHGIPADAPPLFVTVAQNDRWMSGIAMDLFSRWDVAGKSIEFHYFNKGDHGFGTYKQKLPVDHWPDLLGRWLANQQLMRALDE
jgi:acetyl esterase/lipase